MKNRFLFLVGIGALLAMSSCSKDEENLVVKSGEPARLSITLKGTSVDTRALGNTTSPSVAEENKIQRIVVGLFKTDGSTDVIFEKDYTSGYDGSVIEVTGKMVQGSDNGYRDIIVVANAPQYHFNGITKKSDFENRKIDLTQTKDFLPMTGTSSVTLESNKTVTISSPIQITRLVARISLVNIVTAFEPGGLYANSKFHADQVFLYNAMSKCEVDGTYSDPVHGWSAIPPYQGVLGLFENVDLSTPINYPTTTGDFLYFYAFPNLFPTSIDQAFLDGPFTDYTRLVIGGTFDLDGVTSTPNTDLSRVYYPIIVNRVKLLSELNVPIGVGIGVKRNTVYKVAAVIKSKGVDNPDIVINPAYLNVTVTPVAWDLTIPTQTVTF